VNANSTTERELVCDYPTCSRRCSGHPLACGCTTIIPFRRATYEAKPQRVNASGYKFLMSGTLDGWIDFSVTCSDGTHRTYQIMRDDARGIIVALHAVVADITANCMFDRDPLLMPDGHLEGSH
jgi:hypothetical protein